MFWTVLVFCFVFFLPYAEMDEMHRVPEATRGLHAKQIILKDLGQSWAKICCLKSRILSCLSRKRVMIDNKNKPKPELIVCLETWRNTQFHSVAENSILL